MTKAIKSLESRLDTENLFTVYLHYGSDELYLSNQKQLRSQLPYYFWFPKIEGQCIKKDAISQYGCNYPQVKGESSLGIIFIV